MLNIQRLVNKAKYTNARIEVTGEGVIVLLVRNADENGIMSDWIVDSTSTLQEIRDAWTSYITGITTYLNLMVRLPQLIPYICITGMGIDNVQTVLNDYQSSIEYVINNFLTSPLVGENIIIDENTVQAALASFTI